MNADFASRIAFGPGAEQNGLASMVAGLILQNLQDHPKKRDDFARLRGNVSIVAEDAGVAMTLEFAGDHMTVHDGIVGIPNITVRAKSDDIVQMSLLELPRRFGLPNPRGATARVIADKSRRGEVRVFGALLHLPTLLRLTRLLSVN